MIEDVAGDSSAAICSGLLDIMSLIGSLRTRRCMDAQLDAIREDMRAVRFGRVVRKRRHPRSSRLCAAHRGWRQLGQYIHGARRHRCYSDPIAELARRAAAAGLRTASLDEVLCIAAA
jgi:hypothetical protein